MGLISRVSSRTYRFPKMDISETESSISGGDSDQEIMAAFRSGLLKPGQTIELNKLQGKDRKKANINNVEALKLFQENLLNLIKPEIFNSFEVIPHLTIPSDPNREANAQEHASKVHQNLVNDDFKREAQFALEAKSSVIQGLKLLTKFNIPTTRPTDYYAEMAKTDKQMEKVKSKILHNQAEQERRMKLRQIRDQRKKGKEIQMEIKKKRKEEKKDFLKK